MRSLKILLCLFFINATAYSQSVIIEKFVLKTNPLQNKKVDVMVVDSLKKTITEIRGNYTFSVNGFTQILDFNNGVSTINLPIEKSTFLYVKHTNDSGVHSNFIYAKVKDEKIKVYEINAFWLTLIPLLLIFISFMYRKLIIMALFLFVIYIYFTYNNGLSIGTYFETLIDKIRVVSNFINS
ncbi:MAG: hypothetical protein K2Q03_01005 [Sphingobacteriaceae bacterium]|nr:hypothetical protein [Sphingobacteriaceae bacterium]